VTLRHVSFRDIVRHSVTFGCSVRHSKRRNLPLYGRAADARLWLAASKAVGAAMMSALSSAARRYRAVIGRRFWCCFYIVFVRIISAALHKRYVCVIMHFDNFLSVWIHVVESFGVHFVRSRIQGSLRDVQGCQIHFPFRNLSLNYTSAAAI